MTAESSALEDSALENSVMQVARENPREAFETVVRLYQSDVRVLVRRHFGSSADADEVAQEVFVQVYRSLQNYRQEGSLRAWVLAIARNQVLLHFRNERRRQRLTGFAIQPDLLDMGAAESDANPFHHESADAELEALQDCLNRLGKRSRALVEAFYFEKQPAESIAAEMGKKAGAVRMMLMRTRKQLGKCIRLKLNLSNGNDS